MKLAENWSSIPFWALYKRGKKTGFPAEELLSVYRDYGVIRKSDRDDNWNRPGEDMASYQLVDPGDLVLNKMKTWQGSLGISPHRGIVSPAYFVYRPTSTNNPRFMHYALRSDHYIRIYASISKGVRPNQWDLQPEQLDAMRVNIPDLTTQQRIADYLDRETGEIDAMIAKMDQLAETLESRRIAAIRLATQKASADKLWPMVPTEAIFASIGSGTTPKGAENYRDDGTGTPWVTTSELRENIVIATAQNVTDEALASLPSLRVHPSGSVVIAMYGATIGRLGILGVDAAMNQACCAFSNPRDASLQFLYYTLWGQREGIIREAAGGGQPNISQGMLRRWRIPQPPLDEQQRIADHLDLVTSRIDKMLAKVAELKSLLTERRAALITEVVTGRKEVA